MAIVEDALRIEDTARTEPVFGRPAPRGNEAPVVFDNLKEKIERPTVLDHEMDGRIRDIATLQ